MKSSYQTEAGNAWHSNFVGSNLKFPYLELEQKELNIQMWSTREGHSSYPEMWRITLSMDLSTQPDFTPGLQPACGGGFGVQADPWQVVTSVACCTFSLHVRLTLKYSIHFLTNHCFSPGIWLLRIARRNSRNTFTFCPTTTDLLHRRRKGQGWSSAWQGL